MVQQPKRIATFAQAATYTIIFIAILGAVNFLANRYNKSVDTTANKRYTLSDETQKVARGLAQDVTISYWNSSEAFLGAKDLLDRYEQLSPKLKVVYQDIDRNRAQAIAAGVKQRGAITVQVGNKKEDAKSLTEEEITGAMVRALKGGDRTICFTAGYGDGDPNNAENTGFSQVKALTEQNNYKTQVVSLIPMPAIPPGCTVLVVGGPKRDYLQPAVDAIKAYVEGGGHALFLLDPPLKYGTQVDDNPGLVKLMAEWGVKLNSDLVLDLSGVGQLFGMGPELPIVTKYEDHPIVRPMRNMASGFPFVRSLETEPSQVATVKALLATSDAALTTDNLKTPEAKVDPSKKGSHVLAVAGEMNSAPAAAAGQPTPAKGRFVVVGTSGWVDNGFLAFNGNRDLFLNMLNWLSQDEDLISIRPKDPEDRRINMNQHQVNMLFVGSVLGLPLLMLAAGVSVWWKRR